MRACAARLWEQAALQRARQLPAQLLLTAPLQSWQPECTDTQHALQACFAAVDMPRSQEAVNYKGRPGGNLQPQASAGRHVDRELQAPAARCLFSRCAHLCLQRAAASIRDTEYRRQSYACGKIHSATEAPMLLRA